MPGSTARPEIELIIEKKTGDGGGGNFPPTGHNGGGDDGKRPRPGNSSPKRYYTGMALGIVSILMFFMALASAFLVRRGHGVWIPVQVPTLMWINTVVLLTSSATLEMARHRLAQGRLLAYRNLWLVTTAPGIGFLLGQLVAWRQFVSERIYLSSNPPPPPLFTFSRPPP